MIAMMVLIHVYYDDNDNVMIIISGIFVFFYIFTINIVL